MVENADIAKQKPAFSLTTFTCPLESHKTNLLKGYCIDPNCKIPNKFLCEDCIFDDHNGHKVERLKKIDEILNNEKSKSEGLSDSRIAEFLRQVERNFTEETEKFRDRIMDMMKKFSAEFLSQLHTDLFEELKSRKNSNNVEFLDYKELKNLSPEESETIKRVVLENLQQPKNDPLKKDPPQQAKYQNIEEQIEPFNESLRALMTLFETFLQDKMKNYKPENCFHFEFKHFALEWIQKTYSTYEFFFELSENNKIATKTKSGGTMTIVRAKEPLEVGYCHYVEFLINWKSGQDFDVGFANDNVGKLCWLRVPTSYGVSTVGIYCNGEKKSDIGLTDGKKLRLEINLREKVQKCKVLMDYQLIWEMTFEEKEQLFIMAGMRGLKDSIRITSYKKV